MSLAPPVTRDEFSYAGDFYVEASGHNRHRRATVPELKAHFKGSSDAKDHPAHWYEAQLIHYGLKPSKTKGTAKMRLFEAVNGGTCAVPAHVAKVEADLKKEWGKKEREAKAALKLAAAATPAKGTKRKAESTPVSSSAAGVLMKSLSVKADGSVNIEFMQTPAKKAKVSGTTVASATVKGKTTAPVASKKPAADPKVKATPKTAASKTTVTKTTTTKATPVKATPAKPTASKSTQAGKKSPVKTATKPSATTSTTLKPSAAAPRTKQTAKRGGMTATGSTRVTPAVSASAISTAPKKQTARRGGAAVQGKVAPASPAKASGLGFAQGFSDSTNGFDDPPPPYPGSPMDLDDDYHNAPASTSKSPSKAASPASLGLLNGRYSTDVPSITDMAPSFDGDMGFVLTLDGKSLWGNFDFGLIRGIFHLPERPYAASTRQFDFKWRSEDEQEDVFGGHNDRGWISFNGGGRVEGSIYWHEWHHFEGVRTSGQETRSGIPATAMRAEWEEYAERTC